MLTIREAAATIGASVLLAVPAALIAGPAEAADREFRCAGAEVDFDVDKERGRFDVDVEVDAKPGSTWRIALRHDGKRFYRQVRTADRDGEIEIDRKRTNTRGKDVFAVTVKKVGGTSCSRTITLR